MLDMAKTLRNFNLLYFWIIWASLFLCVMSSKQVILLTVHVGANPLYGFYAAAPVYTVAIDMIRKLYPDFMGNITHLPIYLPGYNLCQEGGDHVAEFFTDFYLRRFTHNNRKDVYVVLASPGKICGTNCGLLKVRPVSIVNKYLSLSRMHESSHSFG